MEIWEEERWPLSEFEGQPRITGDMADGTGRVVGEGVEFDEEFARWSAADERPATVGGPYKSKSNPRGRGESRPYKG